MTSLCQNPCACKVYCDTDINKSINYSSFNLRTKQKNLAIKELNINALSFKFLFSTFCLMKLAVNLLLEFMLRIFQPSIWYLTFNQTLIKAAPDCNITCKCSTLPKYVISDLMLNVFMTDIKHFFITIKQSST